MYIARLLYPVKVLGPGDRVGIWMSGCGRRCRGCGNPELWKQQDSQRISLENLKKLLEPLRDNYKIEGFTVTGGDPFYQPEALEELLPYIRGIHKDILVYTGYEYQEIRERYSHLLSYIAVLIDGRYIEEQNHGAVLRGSDNQKIIFIDSAYKQKYVSYLEQERSPVQNFTTSDGIVSTGIHLPEYKERLKTIASGKGLEEADHG